MAIDLDSLTTLIQTPPAQLAAGAVLAGGVWKLFEHIEGVLTDLTKFEIAVWLVGVELSPRVGNWPTEFRAIFEKVFGDRHFSLNCLLRCTVVSVVLTAVLHLLRSDPDSFFSVHDHDLPYVLLFNALSDYLAYGITRWSIAKMAAVQKAVWKLTLLAVDIVLINAMLLLLIPIYLWIADGMKPHYFLDVGEAIAEPFEFYAGMLTLVMMSRGVFQLPAMASSLWLLVYYLAGSLIQFAGRFDSGSRWFHSKFDIEKKPLQAIGLVAGALVACVYWGAALMNRLVRG